jgi:hypothetical protein
VQSLPKISFQTISLILIFSVSVLSSEVFAQNGLSIFEDYGSGSGGSTNQSDDSNDDTALYVVGGLVVAGILVYALVLNKDKKAPEDTTSSTNSNLKLSNVSGLGYNEKIQKVKEKIPVDLFMGIRNNEAIVNDKTYMFGVRVKL